MPVGEKGLQRLESRRAAIRETILKAAEQRFLRQGFRETKMEDIATEAEVSTGSLYRHFRTKEELYQELVRAALKVDRDYLNLAYDQTKPVVEQLIAVGNAYLRFGIDHPLYFRLLAIPDALGPRTPEDAELSARGVRELVAHVAELIEQGITSHQLAPELNEDEEAAKLYAENAADFLHGAWNGLIALSLRDDSLRVDEEDLQAIAKVGAQIVQYGMTPRPSDVGTTLER